MDINVSDYKRAGIFVDEENNSPVDTPAPQEAIVNFVPGFSRKGTVFNRPVLVKSPQDRAKYFGNIDRFLEKKGSFFHRTIDICTQTAPVWAINLLETTSLDQLNYKSVSLAAQYDNLPVLNEQYDSFFNKAGFWQRDTESFLFFAKNTQQMIHFTNLGDSKVTIFMYKSSAAGFNVTADVWYGGEDKVPTWMSKYDLISDYIVKVVIVKGDFSDYAVRAADTYWSKYFTSAGIRKTMVDAFTRDNAVTQLGVYDCSLIPFFRDGNNRDIFIENVINLNSDSTGVFCAYDVDDVETDFPNGRIDIIGQTLVDLDKSKIEFMSYQDTIQEIDSYTNAALDTLGNVIGIGTVSSRTTANSNGILSGLALANTNMTTSAPVLTMTSTSGYANINNTKLSIATNVQTLSALPTPALLSAYRIDTLYIDQTGTVSIAQGTVFNSTYGQSENAAVTAGLTYPATMPNNAIVCGYVFRNASSSGTGATFTLTVSAGNITVAAITTPGSGYAPSTTYNLVISGPGTNGAVTATTNGSGVFTSTTIVTAGTGYTSATAVLNPQVQTNVYVPVALSTSGGFVPLTIGTSATDLVVASSANNVLNVTFASTATATKANYLAWRRIQFFNEIVTTKILAVSTIIDSAGAKVDLSAAIWTDNYTSGTGDKNFVLTVASGSNIRTAPAAGTLAFYYVDDEFTMNTAGLETRQTLTGTSNYGIAAKESQFYLDFYNGRINTGDFFYVNLLNSTSFKFVHYTNLAFPNSVGDYIIMSTADASSLGLAVGSNNTHILIQSHPANAGDFILTTGESNTGSTFAPGLVSDSYLGASQIAFKVNNLVTTYTTLQTISIYDFNQKLYLKMYSVGSNIKVDFMSDSALVTPGTIPSLLLSINATINVYSGEAAYTQTLEIATNSAYTMTDTKFLIDLVRYPEVAVGDYVKAYVDLSSLEVGEYPKKFARILKKTPWSGNAVNNVSYAEITVDVKFDLESYNAGQNFQTTRYTTLENYVDTYKAIVLGGFNTQQTSWPDGTEDRQSSILDIIGKGTNLYDAATNKNTFDFRYLIDSFGNGLTAFSKQQLADITGKRKNCLAFINMPSVKAFKDSSSPSFTNADGTLNTGYIKDGANLQNNPPFLYSFAQGSGTDDGRSTSAYFFPYVNVNDNGRPLRFPPAAYVGNTYMKKLNTTVSGQYPWTVSAGINDGIILGIGSTEMNFTETDYENLYAMGANPLSYAKNVGFYIETEWTALRVPLSSLSFIHTREVLIDLENELVAMLKKYQFKFNIPSIRAKIKREADTICQRYVDKNGLSAFQNIIDTTNNTPVLIDNQIGLLTTNIEVTKAMAIIVNQINVFATGQLAGSTGFTQQ